jgi:hypothetical protein
MPNSRIFGLISLSALLAVTPSLAHHSAAMFDRETEIVLAGTVKEFQYTAPHSWVQVMVENEAGEMVEWSIEGGAPNSLLRRGIKPTSLSPGETVSVRAHPMVDGQPGALIIDVTKPDGSVLRFTGGG